MKLAAIAVLYNPDLNALVRNLLSYADDVEQILLFQNSKIDVLNAPQLLPFADKIQYVGYGENVGIAKALNFGIQWAMDNDYSHLLTLDQDSYFLDGHLKKFRERIKQSTISNVGIYAANPNIQNNKSYESESSTVEISVAITSGSIFPVEVFQKYGFFEDDLFIDCVDHEFCYRIKTMGESKALVFTEIVLMHEIGYPTKIAFGLTTSNYSAFRTYYLIRNHIIMWRRYPTLFKAKTVLIKYYICLRILKILIGEKNKRAKINAINRGIMDGIRVSSKL